MDSPESVLTKLNTSVLLEWTRPHRTECLLLGLEELIRQHSDGDSSMENIDTGQLKMPTKAEGGSPLDTLMAWVKFLRDQQPLMIDDGYLHSGDLWACINKFETKEIAILHLCNRHNADRLARMITSAYAYAPELVYLVGGKMEEPQTFSSCLDRFLNVLQMDEEIREAYHSHGSEGDWTGLEAKLSIRLLSVDARGTKPMNN